MTTLTLCSPVLPSARRQTRRLAASPQRMLPFPAPMARPLSDESRSRPFAHANDPLRNTARIGLRANSGQGAAQVLDTAPRAIATAAVVAMPGETVSVERPGARFARQRVAYAVETVASCIMLLGFLVLALFG